MESQTKSNIPQVIQRLWLVEGKKVYINLLEADYTFIYYYKIKEGGKNGS